MVARAACYAPDALFFFLPWGHDHPVYERPWLTYGLIVACVLAFAATSSIESGATVAVDNAAYRVSILTEAFPDARLSFAVNGLPRELDAIVQPLVDESPTRAHVAGDADLEAAMIDLVAALNHLPLFRFGFRPGAPSALTAVTHAFVHADIGHLFGNMVILFIAGGVLECFWRRSAYVGLYALSGVAGLLAQVAAAPSSTTPMIGASGCIAGLMGAFLVGYPKTKIKVAYFFWVTLRPTWGSVPVPAWFVLPLWVGIELVSALIAPPEGGGIAYWAHVGGFACGAALALVARRSGLVATDAGFEALRQNPDAPPPIVGAPLGLQGRLARIQPSLDGGSPAVRPASGTVAARPEPRDIEESEIPPAQDGDSDLIER